MPIRDKSCLRTPTFTLKQSLSSPKSSDTPGDFIRRSPRSAKIARCARCSDCDFHRSPRLAYEIADIWHVRYRRLNSPHSPSVSVPAIFYVYCCESPVKSTHQVGRFYHMSFQNCHIAAIGEKIARCVRINRWRSNSPRSAYKIARCAALAYGSVTLTQFPSNLHMILPSLCARDLRKKVGLFAV